MAGLKFPNYPIFFNHCLQTQFMFFPVLWSFPRVLRLSEKAALVMTQAQKDTRCKLARPDIKKILVAHLFWISLRREIVHYSEQTCRAKFL